MIDQTTRDSSRHGPELYKAAEALIGVTVGGHFELLELIGVGSTGAVFRSRQHPLGNEVAVKVLHPHLRHKQHLEERFRQEVKASSRLDHPNCLHLLDYGRDPQSQVLFIAMELVRGVSLADIARHEAPLPHLRLVHIAMQVAAALDEAHNKNIIHRDLKPANILLEDRHGEPDFVKVLDFGVAHLQDDLSQSSGAICGTPEYMSPEQARGENLDGRSDLYALGVIMYELAAGQRPFIGDSPLIVTAKQLRQTPTPPSKHHAEIDPKLESIILACLAKTPSQRPGSAAVLYHMLAQTVPAHVLDATGRVKLGGSSRAIDPDDPLVTGDVAAVAWPGHELPSAVTETVTHMSATPRKLIDPRRVRMAIIAGVAAAVLIVGLVAWFVVLRKPSPTAPPAPKDTTAAPGPPAFDPALVQNTRQASWRSASVGSAYGLVFETPPSVEDGAADDDADMGLTFDTTPAVPVALDDAPPPDDATTTSPERARKTTRRRPVKPRARPKKSSVHDMAEAPELKTSEKHAGMLRMAQSHYDQGRMSGAERVLNMILEQDPDHSGAKALLKKVKTAKP